MRAAAVGGAGVSIVADHYITGDAAAACTAVAGGANATVVARCLVVTMGAAGHGLAEVVGAGVVVVTGHEPGAHTGPSRTLVGSGARVPIIAGSLIGSVDTAHQRVADVSRAWVGIVAVHFVAGRALALAALVTLGAEAVVVTGQ